MAKGQAQATNVDKERAKAKKQQAAESEAKAERQDADPILDGGGSVTIAGNEYEMRRLGVLDAFRVARILGAGLRMLRAGTYDALTLGAVFLNAMVQSEQQVTELLADIIGVDHDEFTTDTERFPMDTPVLIIDALAEHQDMSRFFKTLMAIQDRMQPTPEANDKAG